MGQSATAPLDGGDGSDAVYRVDLRSSEAGGAGVKGSASADAEGDRGVQEEKRQSRRAHDRRSAAVQSAAGVLLGAERGSRPAADPALSQLVVHQATRMKNRMAGLL